MAEQELLLAGMSVSQVYDKFVQAGVSRADAASAVAGWILENIGRTRRTFDYATQLDAPDPSCAPAFARTFQHEELVDGVSPVQAGETVTEIGFNKRMHLIEDDIDGLMRDDAKLFACLADLRRLVHDLFQEVRAEINVIHGEIFDCCQQDGRVRPGTLTQVSPGLGRYLGATKFFDKTVSVYDTDRGMVMVPLVETTTGPRGGNALVEKAGDFAAFAAKEPRVRQEFGPGQQVRVRDFVERFGDMTTPDGLSVKTVLGVLPADATFDSVDALVDAVSERQAAALITAGVGDAAIVDTLGVGAAGTTNVGEVGIENFGGIPTNARVALATGGIGTVSGLAEASSDQIIAALRAGGAQATEEDVARWRTGASTILRVGSRLGQIG